ncbi:hypothetical protein C8R44DRAFT_794563 [Mycena epipterygia]|nr:hypothetical protein C8R44DRAFT_794563 [Mycena epipterygia]
MPISDDDSIYDGPLPLINPAEFKKSDDDKMRKYLRSWAETPGIPLNWHKSWDILRATLQKLEERGMEPQAAVMGLLHVEFKREEANSLDASSLAHLKDHLGTNYVPGLESVERAQIQEFCAKALQKISEVSAEITVDNERLRWSTGRHAILRGIVDPYLTLISPMRALPTEILQEIFIACLPECHNSVMHITQAPLLLGRVCSSWRRIALSTAALWSSVHVVVPYVDYPPPITDDVLNPVVQRLSDGLRNWLVYSGACPLSISLFAISRLPAVKRVFVDIIDQYRSRWITHDDLLKLRDLSPEDVPLLEALEIVDTNWDEPHPDSLRFVSVPPNLRSISLKYSHGYVPMPLCSWEHITTLCLESQISFFTLDLEQVLELLEQCANLRNCQLTFPILRGDLTASVTSTPRQITLPQLRMLAVTAELALDGTFNMASILGPLVLPSLQELAVIHLPSDGHFAEDPVVLDMLLALDELVARSSCALKALLIAHAIGDVDNLLRCLRRLPGLTRLDVDHRPLYLSGDPELMPLITALIPSLSESTPVLCPNLLHLRLIHCDTTDAYHPVLQTLIEARCQPPAEGSTWLRTTHLVLNLKCLSTLDGPKISMDMYPSHVQIIEPLEYNHRQPKQTSRWEGIPPEEIEDLSVLS